LDAPRKPAGYDISAATRVLESAVRSRGAPTRIMEPGPHERLGQREQTIVVNDASGSMAEEYDDGHKKIDASCRASCNLVLQKLRIDPEDEVGLITFTDRATSLLQPQQLAAHAQEMIKRLQAMQARGGTDIAAGLDLAGQMLDWQRPGLVRRIVLLSDGYGGAPLACATALKQRGVIIDVVGVGATPDLVDEPLLKRVASTVDGQLRYRFITDQQTLIQHYTQLASKTETA
jgi:Mg-chelatase subunit ChlD